MGQVRTRIAIVIATGFGAGYLPFAPGSWGALFAVIAGWWLLQLPIGWYLGLIAILFFLGVLTATEADRHFSAKTGKPADNKAITIDEWVGMLITLLPLYYFEKNLITVGMAFLLCRLFDTVKFGLAKLADSRHNRWGVMLDDVFAGMHSGIFFFIALWVMYKLF